ncbi:hypothetical protein [Porticoccus sp.]|uniref:hypothetical protein n=1 Tax=Porticoccus sp. TaxID=2024853 RepID=UPI003F6992A5
MYQINTQAIKLVREELDKEVGLLLDLLGQPVESIGWSECREGLSQLHGVFSLLEVVGGEMLVGEIQETLKKAEVGPLDEMVIDAVRHSLELMPGYVNQLQMQGKDSSLFLLPEINQLRAICKQSPLNEYQLLNGLIPDVPMVSSVAARDHDSIEAIRVARHLYQQGLAHVLKGAARPAAIKVMAHGIQRLRNALSDEKEVIYWALVFDVLSALYRGALGFEQSRMRNLMAVERQLRMLAEDAPVEKSYPIPLQQNMLANFLLSGMDTEGSAKLAARLGISPLGFTAADICNARAMFIEDGSESFVGRLAVIGAKIEQLRAMLDEQVLGTGGGNTPFEEVGALFASLSEELKNCELRLAEERCSQHASALGDLMGNSLPAGVIEEMADTLLYLDSIILELQSRPHSGSERALINTLSIKEVVEENIISHAQRRVLQEASNHLAAIMQLTSDYCDGIAGDELAKPLADNFKMVFGAVRILGLTRAEKVAVRCLNIINHSLNSDGQLSLASIIDVFADAVVSLDYYLDNRRWNPGFDDSVLSVAEECLDKLES